MRSLESEAVSQDGSCEVHDSRRSRRWMGLIALAALAVALFAFILSADALAEGRFPTGVAAPTSTETCPSSPGVDGLAPGVQPPAWAEHQFVHFFMRPQAGGACPLAGVAGEHGEILQYQGGPVQHSPQLFLLFWGSNFESGVGLKLSEAFHLFYGNLKSENEVKGSTAAWQGIVDQYWSNEGPVYHNAKIAAEGHITSVTAPKNVTYALLDKTISEWVESVKTNYHLTPNQNAQFVVLTSPGSTFNKEVLPEETVENEKHEKETLYTCGFHKTTGPYTGEHKNEFYSYSLVPYNGDSHCGEEGTKTETEEEKLINGTTDTASHEFAEAVTDPQSSREYSLGERNPYTSSVGWTGKGGNEIADECEKKPGARLPYRSWVTLLWDDLGGYEKGSPEGECKLEDPPYAAPSAPSATTGVATGITTTEATVAGSVNPNGPDAHYYFEYGTTTSYGTKIPTPPGNDAGFGTKAVPVSVKISGLKAGTLYHYRLVASSWVGTTDGVDQTFRTAGWTIQSTQNPHGSNETDEFRGVSCWSATGCDAVGLNTNSEDAIVGLVERWNGSGWEVQSTPKSTGAKEDDLESVACRSASECEATGYAEVAEGKHITLAERWNGTAWSVQSTPTTKGEDSNLVSVSCASASECVASGFSLPSIGIYAALAELWNGKEWKILTTATLPKEDEESRFESISCPSAKDCIAVGGVYNRSEGSVPLVESYNGSTWTVQSTPTPEHSIGAQLSGVSCSATSACTAVGGYDNVAENGERALIERYNGTSWQLQESPSPVGKLAPKESYWALSAVSCPTASSCVAVGSYDESASGKKLLLGEEWNGSRWELASPVDRTGVWYDEARGVSCSAALTCTLAGLSWKENNHNSTETLAERMEP